MQRAETIDDDTSGIDFVKEYIKRQCELCNENERDHIFTNDEFVEKVLIAIQKHSQATNDVPRGADGDETENLVNEYQAHIDACDDAKAQLENAEYADVDADESGATKAEEAAAVSTDEIVNAIEYFSIVIQRENDDSVQLSVHFNEDVDGLEFETVKQQGNPTLSDSRRAEQRRDGMVQRLRSRLRQFDAMGIKNAIENIRIIDKPTGTFITIRGNYRNMAIKVREYADNNIVPVDLDLLKRDMDDHIDRCMLENQEVIMRSKEEENMSEIEKASLNEHVPNVVMPSTHFHYSEFFCEDTQKTQAYLVGGEIGCGKTWFCAKGIRQYWGLNDAYLLYLKMNHDDKAAKSRPPLSDNENVRLWRKTVSDLLYKNRSLVKGHDQRILRALSSILDLTSNEWAQGLFEGMIEAQAPQLFKNWLHGKSTKAIKKYIIVLDNVEHNLDFARFMIECHQRYIPRKFFHSRTKRLATDCNIMLVGAGLETVHSKWYNYIASYRMKCRLVKLLPPNVKEFSKAFDHKYLSAEEIEQMLKVGTMPSIIKTNTRMLMDGLKMFLDCPTFQLGDVGELYKPLLVKLFSTPEAMAVPFNQHMLLNGLNAMLPDERSKCLHRSWKHELQVRILSAKHS